MFNNSRMSTTAGFMEPNELNSPARKTKGEVQRLQSIVPVCVRQLRDCGSDEFKLFGMQTQILSLVGILREYEVQSTKATYQIEDHTGTISAIWWLESDGASSPNLPLVKEGCYLRIYGSLRVQEGQKMLMVLRMFPVDNLNEITTHLLEVVHARLEAENMQKGGENMNRIKKNNPGVELAQSMAGFPDDSGTANTGLSNLQTKVYNIIKGSTSLAGMHVGIILDKFMQNQHREVKAALEFLTSEGHAYTTVDHDHFKVTESV